MKNNISITNTEASIVTTEEIVIAADSAILYRIDLKDILKSLQSQLNGRPKYKLEWTFRNKKYGITSIYSIEFVNDLNEIKLLIVNNTKEAAFIKKNTIIGQITAVATKKLKYIKKKENIKFIAYQAFINSLATEKQNQNIFAINSIIESIADRFDLICKKYELENNIKIQSRLEKTESVRRLQCVEAKENAGTTDEIRCESLAEIMKVIRDRAEHLTSINRSISNATEIEETSKEETAKEDTAKEETADLSTDKHFINESDILEKEIVKEIIDNNIDRIALEFSRDVLMAKILNVLLRD